MRRSNIVMIAATVMMSSMSYGKTAVIGNPGALKETQVERHFFRKGKKVGYKLGYNAGYAAGIKFAKKRLDKYKGRVAAMEAGKYLSRRAKITPPRLYQKTTPDGVKVVVGGCKIEKQLTTKEILSLPVYDGQEEGAREYKASRKTPDYSNPYMEGNKNVISNGIYLPGVDPAPKESSLGGDEVSMVKKAFPDTEFYRTLFRRTGVMFSIVSGNRINVTFRSERDAASFMARHELEPGVDSN